MRKLLLSLLLAVATVLPAQAQDKAQAQALKVIGFMSDFDLKDDAVGLCKAVMDGIAPGVRIIDITHQVEPYDIAAAARFLAGSAPYFPKDAVFVVVVDPGVGSARKAIIARTKSGRSFVLPDNGLMTLVQDQDEIIAAREISNPAWMIGARLSSTFHGRDIFAPAAARLAAGADWTEAGPPVDVARLVRLDLKQARIDQQGAHAEVIGTDGPYGNLILNLPAERFAELGYAIGDRVDLAIDGVPFSIPLVHTFADVPVGKALLYIDSRGRLGLAINQGNFAEAFKVRTGSALFIPRK